MSIQTVVSVMSDNIMKKPEVVVFAGPNGSGKSTIKGDEWVKGLYINADDIQREKRISNLEAAQIADSLRDHCLKERKDFTFETVLSSPWKLQFLRQAKAAGYFIRGYYILTCDPWLNVARVQARVISGQHDVPTEKILSRYEKSLANVPEYLSLCDVCHIYDNTGDGPFRICRKHKTSIKFFENEYWDYAAIAKLVLGQRELSEQNGIEC